MPKVKGFSQAKSAGDFYFAHYGDQPYTRLSFLCPCGCGILAGVHIRPDGAKDEACWSWNKDEDKPTVAPSILIMPDHWHGYLTDGVFKAC